MYIKLFTFPKPKGCLTRIEGSPLTNSCFFDIRIKTPPRNKSEQILVVLISLPTDNKSMPSLCTFLAAFIPQRCLPPLTLQILRRRLRSRRPSRSGLFIVPTTGCFFPWFASNTTKFSNLIWFVKIHHITYLSFSNAKTKSGERIPMMYRHTIYGDLRTADQ